MAKFGEIRVSWPPEPRDALEVRRVGSDPSVEFRRGRDPEPREAFDVARDTAPEPMPKDELDTRRDSCDIGVAASWHRSQSQSLKMTRKYVKILKRINLILLHISYIKIYEVILIIKLT